VNIFYEYILCILCVDFGYIFIQYNIVELNFNPILIHPSIPPPAPSQQWRPPSFSPSPLSPWSASLQPRTTMVDMDTPHTHSQAVPTPDSSPVSFVSVYSWCVQFLSFGLTLTLFFHANFLFSFFLIFLFIFLICFFNPFILSPSSFPLFQIFINKVIYISLKYCFRFRR